VPGVIVIARHAPSASQEFILKPIDTALSSAGQRIALRPKGNADRYSGQIQKQNTFPS
jgi:hypothetical protein